MMLTRKTDGSHMTKKRRQLKRKRRSKAYSKALLAKLRKQYGLDTLRREKLRAMRKAVVATKGDVFLAAALLGMGKTSLYRDLPQAKRVE